jgi:HPt (histidine-containing phosphotransfer) domain-containing protein
MAHEHTFTTFDLDGALVMTGGDRGLLSQIAVLLVKQIAERRDKMATALAARDRPSLGREAHALKGALLTLAARDLSAKCADMEKQAKSAEWVRVAALWAELQPLLSLCADELLKAPSALAEQAA